MRTLNEQYQLLKEGKGHKDVFLKEARSKFPQWIRNASTLKETTTILKNKGIINENIVDTKPINQLVSSKKEYVHSGYNKIMFFSCFMPKNTMFFCFCTEIYLTASIFYTMTSILMEDFYVRQKRIVKIHAVNLKELIKLSAEIS